MKMRERNENAAKTALLIHPMLSSAEGIEQCMTSYWGEDVHCFLPDLFAHGEQIVRAADCKSLSEKPVRGFSTVYSAHQTGGRCAVSQTFRIGCRITVFNFSGAVFRASDR